METRGLESALWRATRNRRVSLHALVGLALACLLSACAGATTSAGVGQRVGVPGRFEETDSQVGGSRSDVIGIVTRQAGDTVWLAENPAGSERVFVIPSGTVLSPRLPRQRTDAWAVGDSIRVRTESTASGREDQLTQTWVVAGLRGDTLLLEGTQAHPIEVSASAAGARLERQTLHPRPKGPLLLGSGLLAAGAVVLAAWPWSDGTECTGFGPCIQGQDVAGALLHIGLVSGGLGSLLSAGVARVGWDEVDPASLPVLVAPGPVGNVEVRLRWPLGRR